MTVEIGVVAFKIAANPEAMWLWPQTTRQNGTALLSRPIPENASHALRLPGIFIPSAFTNAFRITAANPTRRNTIVKGGNALIWTAAEEK